MNFASVQENHLYDPSNQQLTVYIDYENCIPFFIGIWDIIGSVARDVLNRHNVMKF